VLLIHGGVQGGLGGGPESFANQQALSTLGWRLYVADRPGFGQSASRGVDDMEADAVWITDLLGDGSHLIGHSWGGAEALLAAARRPEKVRSLILVEPALHPLLASEEPLKNNEAFKAEAGSNARVMLATTTPASYAIAFARTLGASDSDHAAMNESAVQLAADERLATTFGCALLAAKMASPPAMVAAAESVRRAGVQVLTISGGWSPTFDAVCATAARLTGGRHAIVAAPNHFPQRANAGDFNTIVNRFMREAERLSISCHEDSK
jgi:pimeloyl-ACP methyl ester carboxylesterase